MASGGAVALWRGAWEPAEESQPEGREGEDGGGQQRSNVQLSNQSWTAKLDREVDICAKLDIRAADGRVPPTGGSPIVRALGVRGSRAD